MDTIPQEVIKYLEANEGFRWAGPICRAVHDLTGHKEDVISRRLREMENKGIIEKDKQQIDGKGPKCVLYRLKPIPKPATGALMTLEVKQLSFN